MKSGDLEFSARLADTWMKKKEKKGEKSAVQWLLGAEGDASCVCCWVGQEALITHHLGNAHISHYLLTFSWVPHCTEPAPCLSCVIKQNRVRAGPVALGCEAEYAEFPLSAWKCDMWAQYKLNFQSLKVSVSSESQWRKIRCSFSLRDGKILYPSVL